MVLCLICVPSKSPTCSADKGGQISDLLKQTFQSYHLGQRGVIAPEVFPLLLPSAYHLMSTSEFIAVLWLLTFRSW